MRQFETGAIRDDDEGKLDFEGCLSPLALEAFAEYSNSELLRKVQELNARYPNK